MLDALCHLPLFATDDEALAYFAQGARDGVTDVLCAGTDPRLPEAFDVAHVTRVHRAFGVHPQHASDDLRDDQMRALEARLDTAPGVVAIGECGFDHRPNQPPLDVQERTLRAQLAIARARKLPVILHLVRTWVRALDIIDEDGPLPGGGVWHGFSGPTEAIARARKAGLALSIGGLVLNAWSRRLHEALPSIPAEMLLVETDMPHDPPVRLAAIVAEVARLRGEDPGDVAKRTDANARRVFALA